LAGESFEPQATFDRSNALNEIEVNREITHPNPGR